MNSMKPMLCNNKQKQKQPVPPSPPPPPPPNPSQPTTCTSLPSSRNCRPSSVIHLTVMHLTYRWPPNSLCAPRAHRQHTDSFRGYSLFTSSMQQRHPRPSFMNCPYHALTGVLTDQKRGPNCRLLFNLIPEHPFTMLSTSLYDDIRAKEASQKRICDLKRERGELDIV